MSIPEGLKLVPVDAHVEKAFDVTDGKHLPTIKITLPACHPDDTNAWDRRDAIGLMVKTMLAADPAKPHPIYDEAVNAAVLGAQNLNAAMATIDILRAQLAERDALLTDLGVEPDGVSDVYQRLLLNAERYEYLREYMAVENFPSEHPDWSQPSEYESRRIDELCDSAMSRAKAGEDE